MPRDGAITFRDIAGKLAVLRITCDKCGRSDQYRVDQLPHCRRVVIKRQTAVVVARGTPHRFRRSGHVV
jgi:hypothetical protein